MNGGLRFNGEPNRMWILALALLGLALLMTSGCMRQARSGLAAISSSSKPYQEFVGDPVALATVKTVAVLPFDDRSPEPGFKALEFSTRLANQLTSKGELKVIYPKEILAAQEAENQRIRRHNSEYRHRTMLGLKVEEMRPDQLRQAREGLRESVAGEERTRKAYLDSVRNVSDAVKLARMLKADAVVMGTVTDYDPYMRPRISLFMRVVATGTTDGEAQALAELCQWGVPRSQSVAHGIIWQRQQNFDSRDGNIGLGAYTEALTHHVDNQVYDTESYIRVPRLYADYVGHVLARGVLDARKDAIGEAEKRAWAAAKQQKLAKEKVRERLHALVNRHPQLPDADQVMAQNHRVQTDRQWRPDIYNRSRPDKAQTLYPQPEKR